MTRRSRLRCPLWLTRLEDRVQPANLPNVQVNDPLADTFLRQDTQSETSTLVYDRNGQKIVVSAFNDFGDFKSGVSNRLLGYARSTDGGATFTDLGSPPYNGIGSDPSLARNTATNRIYLSSLSFTPTFYNVFHSDDDGLNWSPPVNGLPGIDTSNWDKGWVVVDNEAGAGQGTVYLVARSRPGAAAAGIWLSRSGSNGTDFETPIRISTSPDVHWPNVVVVNHAAYVFWVEREGTGPLYTHTIKVRRLAPDGVTLGDIHTVVTLQNKTADYAPTLMGFANPSNPIAAVNPVSGTIYMTYRDAVEQGGVITDRGNVYLVRSLNGTGSAWTAREKVSDDTGTNDQFTPAVAVTPDGTKLVVAYYDRRHSYTNSMIDYYAAVADVDAQTGEPKFRANQRISTRSFPAFVNVHPLTPLNYMGEYDVVNADNDHFYFVWSDHRNGSHPDAGHRGRQQDIRFAKSHVNATGPEIIYTTPAGGQFAAADRVSIYFNQAMDTKSFSVADDVASFTGPDGGSLAGQITGFQWQSNRQLDITFAPQAAEGEYAMVVGPNVLSDKGAAMDDNLNGTNGETAGTFNDRVTVSFERVSPVVDEVSDREDGKYKPSERSLPELIGLAADIYGLATGPVAPPVITFDPTQFGSAKTITLVADRGDIRVAAPMTIVGPGPTKLTLDAAGDSRPFRIDVPTVSGQAVAIGGLTLTNGNAGTGPPSLFFGFGGAVVVVDENLTLTGCKISNNSATNQGGGVHVVSPAGSLTLNDCELSGNTSNKSGGAVSLAAAAALSLSRTSISGNTSFNAAGGGLYVGAGGTLTVTDSTISGNNAPANKNGGGLYLKAASATIVNSTVFGNTAGKGGGVFVNGDGGNAVVKVYNSTVTNNNAASADDDFAGGGIGFVDFETGDAIELDSTIVAGNTLTDTQKSKGADIGGTQKSGTVGQVTALFSLIKSTDGFTIVGDPTINKNQLGLDPGFKSGLLENKGGPTLTVALDASSPAVDRGRNTLNLNYDQRSVGFARDVKILSDDTVTTTVDIGAFEIHDTVQVVSVATKVAGITSQSMVTSIEITFNQAVDFVGVSPTMLLDRVTAVGPEQPGVTGLVNISVSRDSALKVVTITFKQTGDNPILGVGSPSAPSLPDGTYDLTIFSAKVAGSYGNGQLDGDSDGLAGGDFLQQGGQSNGLYRLFGDGNGDGIVDVRDEDLFLAALNNPANYTAAFDSNNDGRIDSVDYVYFQQRFGLMVP